MMIWKVKQPILLLFATKHFQEKNPKTTVVVGNQITEASQNS